MPQVSTSSSATPSIPHDEICFLTRTRNYTNRRVHWIAPNHRHPDRQQAVEERLIDIGAVPENFTLDHPSNMSMLAPHVYTSLTKYDLIAFAPSRATLDTLIKAAEQRNEFLQNQLSLGLTAPVEKDIAYKSLLHFLSNSDLDLAKMPFHLVPLHPVHFLPDRQPLAVFSEAEVAYKQYFAIPGDPQDAVAVLSSDGQPIPAFSAPPRLGDSSGLSHNLNPLLVILNADSKFRRYLRLEPESLTPLEGGVREVMEKTMRFVDLLYEIPAQVERGNSSASVTVATPGRQEESSLATGTATKDRFQQRLDALRVRAEQSGDSVDLAEYGRELMGIHREEEWDQDNEEVMQSILRSGDGEPFAHLPPVGPRLPPPG